mmetsp:Transcript_44870/g.109426  ORF Transcript_44870/g.109426 Transcript_44870/m.109426 type:complete len:168 (+) Transcript_44870:94-597(+)
MVDMRVIAMCVDTTFNAYVVGSTVFYFFVSSPVMMKNLGRERFVPLMMSLMRVYFTSICVALSASLAATYMHCEGEITSTTFLTQAAGLTCALINKFVIGPKALAAGKASFEERKGKDKDGSLEKFAVEGGASTTKVWHQTVVVFVFAMLGGVLPHLYELMSRVRDV